MKHLDQIFEFGFGKAGSFARDTLAPLGPAFGGYLLFEARWYCAAAVIWWLEWVRRVSWMCLRKRSLREYAAKQCCRRRLDQPTLEFWSWVIVDAFLRPVRREFVHHSRTLGDMGWRGVPGKIVGQLEKQ